MGRRPLAEKAGFELLRRKYLQRIEESPATCVVIAFRAEADHVAIRDHVEGRSRGRGGDVRDESRTRSY